MKYGLSLIDVCKDIFFGIEIETCYHNLKKSVNKQYKNDNAKYKQSIIDNEKNIYGCFKEKSKHYQSPSLQWIYCHPTEENCGGYKNWIVTSDATVYCQLTTLVDEFYSINYGNKSKEIPKIQFYPIELVSPVLNMNIDETKSGEGLEIFSYIYFGWLMDRNLVYTVNDSQGLHVNVSYPKMGMGEYESKFLKMLYIIEPILVNMITEERRDLLLGTLRETSFADIDMESVHGKHSIMKIHKDRLELRVFGGTMVYNEIYLLTLFSVLLLGASILTSDEKLDSLLEVTDIQELFDELASFIVDNKTVNFVVKQYNTNKLSESPPIKPYTNDVDLFPAFEFNKTHMERLKPAMTTMC